MTLKTQSSHTQIHFTMDKRAAEQFIEEYVALCKRSGMYLWSGEPWYGLDLIDGGIDEDKIRKYIKVYDE